MASVSALAEELGVDRTVLYQWQRQKDAGHEGTPTSAVRELRKEACAGGEDVGSGFSQRCLAKNRGSTPEKQGLWRGGIYDQIREVMPMQGSLSIERMCQLARVSHAGFYRSLQDRVLVEESMDVRSAIQRIALEHRRRYGYRRVTAELRRCGMLVNHKRVARIMREDSLLAAQPKRFVTTTDSDHALEIYVNLARRMTLTGVDQLWIADITYIRLKSEFVYLALILDGFSRKVVGWKLDRTLASRLATEALELAIEARKPLPGLVLSSAETFEAHAAPCSDHSNHCAEMAQTMRHARQRGEELHMSDEELAFYDALEINDAAVKIMGDVILRQIAQELTEIVRRNTTIDWTMKENVRAKLRTLVKRLLRKYGYPPDKQEKATETVLAQAELLCKDWAA